MPWSFTHYKTEIERSQQRSRLIILTYCSLVCHQARQSPVQSLPVPYKIPQPESQGGAVLLDTEICKDVGEVLCLGGVLRVENWTRNTAEVYHCTVTTGN